MNATISASKIASLIGGRLVGDDVVVSGACTLENPKSGAIGYLKSAARVKNPSDLPLSSVWIVPKP